MKYIDTLSYNEKIFYKEFKKIYKIVRKSGYFGRIYPIEDKIKCYAYFVVTGIEKADPSLEFALMRSIGRALEDSKWLIMMSYWDGGTDEISQATKRSFDSHILKCKEKFPHSPEEDIPVDWALFRFVEGINKVIDIKNNAPCPIEAIAALDEYRSRK